MGKPIFIDNGKGERKKVDIKSQDRAKKQIGNEERF